MHRVSITSSVVAITDCDNADTPEVFDESIWTNSDKAGLGAYERSKTLAERAAWEFVEKLPEGQKIELTTVCPGLAVGPTMIKGDFSSGKIMCWFMNNDLPGGIPQIAFSPVDVREVAQAHVNCIKRDEAQGKRFILTG